MLLRGLWVGCAFLLPASFIMAKMAPEDARHKGDVAQPWAMLSGGLFVIAVLCLIVAIVIVVVRYVTAKRGSNTLTAKRWPSGR
jgi:disulfide bond formation protein DsbB